MNAAESLERRTLETLHDRGEVRLIDLAEVLGEPHWLVQRLMVELARRGHVEIRRRGPHGLTARLPVRESQLTPLQQNYLKAFENWLHNQDSPLALELRLITLNDMLAEADVDTGPRPVDEERMRTLVRLVLEFGLPKDRRPAPLAS